MFNLFYFSRLFKLLNFSQGTCTNVESISYDTLFDTYDLYLVMIYNTYTVDSLVTKIAGARVRRGAISVLLFAVLGAYWLADTVLVHLISEIALAYVWRYAFSVLAIAAIR